MPKRHLTAQEIIKANGYFNDHLKPSVSNPGYYEYEDNWSDAKIASVLHQDIQPQAIGNLRLRLFGKLDMKAGDIAGNVTRLRELETLVTNLLTCYGELEVKYNKLVDTLALNKVANVIHLKTTVKEEKKNG